ncbi:hypothetical protein CKQ54_10980 [Rahnella variigena]|uniref:Uncharacterized protein n=2 Tax=Rahnella variigena TaxID=574964 RepID=A0ABX9PW69_9GAMM|nr:hypothetical protein D6D38_01860 [Rahnella variigena]RKF68852.1 hypothetical protein CKQ54_10980 [Rahnella variigena]
MLFTKLFTKKNELTKSHTVASYPLPKSEVKKTELHISRNLSAEITRRLYDTINKNIDRDIRRFGKSAMNSSMLADLSRMNYYIDNKKISIPGNETQSKINFSTQIIEPKNQWIQEHIGSLSSFLHQGIFPDFFGAVDNWKASDGSKWEIAMVSLDRNRTDTRFYISSTGMIKLISQANISNIILRNNDIIMVDKKRSLFNLQLSFRAVAMPEKCLITTQGNAADGCRMELHGMELLE